MSDLAKYSMTRSITYEVSLKRFVIGMSSVPAVRLIIFVRELVVEDVTPEDKCVDFFIHSHCLGQTYAIEMPLEPVDDS